jgi:hypothetical protein
MKLLSYCILSFILGFIAAFSVEESNDGFAIFSINHKIITLELPTCCIKNVSVSTTGTM